MEIKKEICFGLIGYPLSHSFSKKYFTAKFEHLKLNAEYKLFPIENLDAFPALINDNSGLRGLNVTIPYKQSVLPFLNKLDDIAAKTGAVNTIKINRAISGAIELIGYNTDVFGFRESIKPFLESHHTHALILGTGGAAQAVKFVLDEMGLNTFFVSRTKNKTKNILSYTDLNRNVIETCQLIVNATPVGMYPNTGNFPLIPYEYITGKHFLYDLIYNPEETIFLRKGKEKGSNALNGSSMLYFQAEKAWKIWNE